MWYLIVSIPDLCTLTYFNHSPSKIVIQPVEKIIYDPNSSTRLKNIEFAILFLKVLNIDFLLILISLNVAERLLLF